MTPEEITSLGEVAAIAARRAIQKANQVGVDQNRGQFVAMVATALCAIPEGLRGKETIDFLRVEAVNPYAKN